MSENFAEIVNQVRKNDVLVSELDLSARAYNALRLNGIKYLSEFVAMDMEDLKKLNLVSTSIAEELFLSAREQLYILRKSGVEGGTDAATEEQSVALESIEEGDKPDAAQDFAENNDPVCGAQCVVLNECEEKGQDTLSLETAEKTELDDDRPIEVLGLSVRAYNCLKRAKIETIRQLSVMTLGELSKVKNMGRKTVEEIAGKTISLVSEEVSANDGSDENRPSMDTADTRQAPEELSSNIINRLLTAELQTGLTLIDFANEALELMPNLRKRTKQEIVETVKETQKATLKNTGRLPEKAAIPETVYRSDDRPIEQLNFSVRSYNCLKRAKIVTVQQLLDTTPEDLLKIRNLGRKSLDEITLFLHNYIPPKALVKKTDYTAEELIPHVLNAFKVPFKGLSYEEIKEDLPEEACDSTIKQAIGKLLKEKSIEYVDYRCYKTYPSFYEYFDRFLETLSEREREIMTRRYAGDTLEAIAQDQGITRERIRQVEAKLNRRIRKEYVKESGYSVFDEDYYETLYTKCALPNAFWYEELGLPQASVRYLNNSFAAGTAKPEEVLTDEEIPISLRYRLRNFLDRDKIRIDGTLFPPKRAELEDYALRKFAQDELVFERFVELYNGMLEANGVLFDEKIYYTESNLRTRTNKFADSLYCLWKQGERLRYYDIQSRDYTELLETLSLESYRNTELSTRKFMDAYPDVMAKYDIRDPHELHNLLKKISKQYGLESIRFSRQPNLQFGEFDRNRAIAEALIMLSPVTQADLADYLYQEYGYERATLVANYLTPFREFYHNGVYSVDFKHIPDERAKLLQSRLKEDFYFVDEIKHIYLDLFSDACEEEINPYSLKALGFQVNTNYCFRNYTSAAAYFTYLLTKDDLYDVREILHRYGSLQMFNQTYNELLKAHRIYRYEPYKIITMTRLARLNVTMDQIDDYCSAVRENVEDDSYFTIVSLRHSGFTHALDGLGFDDYFYASLLGTDSRFSSQRVFGEVVLYNGQVFGHFSVADFLRYQLRKYDAVELDEFVQDMEEEFGVKIPARHEVTNALIGTGMYYDTIMDKIYRDKSLYYEDFDD